MADLDSVVMGMLSNTFGERFCTDYLERKIYSADMAVMPSMVRPLVGDTTPEGIVQPVSEEELVILVQLAREKKLHLTPRGRATSGYGGVLPLRGGVVVEFNRMAQILAIDSAARTATVQPGIIWKDLEYALNQEGLTACLYPTSFPSSSVGGWLAQGGAGIGSYEYGYFREVVESVRLVRPDGEIQELRGGDIDLVADANGVTGFISQLTIRVKPLKPMHVRLIAFNTARQTADFLTSLYDRRVLLWSVSFINPTTARLRNQLPPSLRHGHPGESISRVVLPEQYIVQLACTTDRCELVEAEVTELVARHGGVYLSEEICRHEWAARFSPMRIKRIAPSLIPSEVVVPVNQLAGVLDEIGREIKHPFAVEGLAVNQREIVLLGFILHDERRFDFNLAFGLALSVLRKAEQHGGRPYATGLYFSNLAARILGQGRLERLRRFKREHDPQGLFNPGKVTEGSLVAETVSLGSAVEPLVRVFGNWIQSRPPGELFQERKGIPGDIAWYAYACSQCGYCVDQCDQYYGRGWLSQSPRGKWNYLKLVLEGEVEFTQQAVNNFLACTTCEMCNHTCDLDLPNESSWLKLRGLLVDKWGYHTFPPFEIMVNTLRQQGNIWGGYGKERDAWMIEELRPNLVDKSDYAYFVGCTSSYVEHDLARSAGLLLQAAGIKFAYLGQQELCCGIPMLVAGRWEVFDEIAARNIDQMKQTGAGTIITTCPACWLVWEIYYRKWAQEHSVEYPFHARHYADVLADRIREGVFTFPGNINRAVTYHDPCHMGRAGGCYEGPREVINAIPGSNYREMRFHHDHAHCCGSVVSLIADPDVALEIGAARLQEAIASGADTLVTACPCCRVQLKLTADKKGLPIQVRDLATLAMESLGRKVADSDAVINEKWAVFDAMIRMMTPAGMAAMMADMIPEMIEAMPDIYRGMMNLVINTPRSLREPMLATMQGLMPSLFPILLPEMLPKLMPTMLAEVEKAIPMPRYLEEQMPQLLPRTMSVLLPKMLPEIIPHFLPRMLDYLRRAEAVGG